MSCGPRLIPQCQEIESLNSQLKKNTFYWSVITERRAICNKEDCIYVSCMQFFKLTFNFNVVFDLDLEVEGVSVENKDTFLCLEVSSVVVILELVPCYFKLK